MPQTNNASTLLTRMAQEPMLVAPGSEEMLATYLTSMQAHDQFAQAHEATASAEEDEEFWGDEDDEFMAWLRPYNVKAGVLTIPVYGVLIHRMSFKFGNWATGYQYIQKAFDRGLEDPEVSSIVFDHNSPGGMVAGNFELCEHVAANRGAKRIIAVANDYSFSASYNLAAAADEIVLTRSGGVGSVGVVTMHVDYSDALAKSGIKVTFIHAGEHKVEGNPYEKLPKSAKDRIQARVDRLYGEFVALVAANRGLDEQAVRDTEALTYDASDALEVGFADRIGSMDDEMAALTEAAEKEKIMSFTQEQMDAAVAAAKAEGVTEGTATGKAEGVNEGTAAERARATAIMGSDEAKSRPAAAQMMVDLGVPADKASEQLAKLPEEAKVAKTDDKADNKGKSSFELAMEGTDNPNVGANNAQDNASDDPMAVADGIFASAGYPAAARQ